MKINKINFNRVYIWPNKNKYLFNNHLINYNFKIKLTTHTDKFLVILACKVKYISANDFLLRLSAKIFS